MKIGYIMQEGGPDVRQRPLTGPANHVVKVYRELGALGHSMHFLARYDGSLWRSDDLEKFERVSTPALDQGFRRKIEQLVRGTQSRLRLPYINLFESLRFAQACQQVMSDCDLIYERMGWMSLGGGIAAQRMGIPLILEANNGDFITELERLGVAPQGLQRWMAVELMRRAAHQASHVIASGNGHRNRFLEWYRMRSDKVTTVENGSELVHLLKRDQLRAFSAPKNLDRPITVVFVGAFEPWHGIHVLLHAFAQVVRKIDRIRLVLIGSGSQWDQIHQLITSLELGPYVELTGQLDIQRVAGYLSDADIGVAPYCGWIEYSGLKLFDYKAAGLAIITSGENGQPVTIEHGSTGLIVPPCQQEALAESIITLATDEDYRQRLGREARIVAENCHTWKYTAERIQDVLEYVLKDKTKVVGAQS